MAYAFHSSTLEAEAGITPSSRPACSTEWIPGQSNKGREGNHLKEKTIENVIE